MPSQRVSFTVCRAKTGRETGYDRHYGDMHAAMRGQGITSTSGRDASTRAVEAGSRLVSAPAGATFCVLQMPRGNLEVVSPRALVLAAIAEAILGRPATPDCALLTGNLFSEHDVISCKVKLAGHHQY